MFGKRPKTVKVTVYSSRNLKPRKGDGDPLAWVVFGFGKEKCCTSQIRDRNAKWNEESTFTLADSKSPLKINVKDKEDFLGQILIPLGEIPSDEHFLKWIPLGPHKKNSNPQGELCLDCWVEDFYDDGEEIINSHSPKSGKFFRKNLNKLTGRSPESNRKNISPNDERKSSYSLGVTSIKGSVSIEDLSSRTNGKTSPLFSRKFGNKNKDSLLAPDAYTNIRKSVSTFALNGPTTPPPSASPDNSSPTGVNIRRSSPNDVVGTTNTTGSAGLPTIKEQCYPPKIVSIVPSSGPANGGTLIQITGKYLGNSKDDITRLMVAGCNCLSSIEYYSPNKIMCTTCESVGKGPITLSTRSGGMSSSKAMFEFVEQKLEDEENIHNTTIDSGRSSGASVNADSREKDELIEKLRSEVEELRHDNGELREYIDRLVVYLMDKYPSALESCRMYR